MLSVYKSKEECCGCGACALICGKQAISMKLDEYGFNYPEIDQKKCVDCGLCIKVCSFKPGPDKGALVTVAAQRKSDDICKSASGGVFAELATSIIKIGGIVYGCTYRRDNGLLSPVISEAATQDEIEPMLGSKYVYSYTNDIFIKVKKRLINNNVVLFSGLPCQVAALKGFLGKDYGNLITIDIICHGTPNVNLFQMFIANLEKKIRGKITKFNFRGKHKGWGNYTYTYTYIDNKGQEHNLWGDFDAHVYYQLFLKSSVFRESCYHCPFASMNRPSDITIGDCWGIETEHPELDQNNGGKFNFKKGMSCIIINTQKGYDILNNHADGFEFAPISLESIIKYNQQLHSPSKDSKYRKKYYEAFLHGGYSKLKRMYYRLEWMNIFKSKIYNIIHTKNNSTK